MAEATAKGELAAVSFTGLACVLHHEWHKARFACPQEFNADLALTLKGGRVLCCWTREGRVSRLLAERSCRAEQASQSRTARRRRLPFRGVLGPCLTFLSMHYTLVSEPAQSSIAVQRMRGADRYSQRSADAVHRASPVLLSAWKRVTWTTAPSKTQRLIDHASSHDEEGKRWSQKHILRSSPFLCRSVVLGSKKHKPNMMYMWPNGQRHQVLEICSFEDRTFGLPHRKRSAANMRIARVILDFPVAR
jgi:hypothetical protein